MEAQLLRRMCRGISPTELRRQIATAWLIVTLLVLCEPGPSTVAAAEMKRVANTTLKFPQEPPQSGYTMVEAWPGIQFTNPVAVVTAPGDTNRIFVLERGGRVWVIRDLANPSPALFMDITDRVDSDYSKGGAEGLSSIAFHPNFRTNRTFYAVYTTFARTALGSGRHNRLSKFSISPTDPNTALPSSEMPLITQKDDAYGHNWNHVLFGPDDYLYVAMGDEGESHDQAGNSQRIDKDFYSAILRIDVDRRPRNLQPNPHPAITAGAYAIPADNPFVRTTVFDGRSVDPAKVRTEFYAVGFRNPWRLWFDESTGRLYCGDVGQHAAEEIDLIVKGGNYGWAYFEANRKGFKGDPPPGIVLQPPLLEIPHGSGPFEGTSVTGGAVYRGSRFPELNGAYIFADYAAGNIWTLRHEGNRVTEWKRLTGNPGIVGIGVHPSNRELLFVDHDEGKIFRLGFGNDIKLPPTLADTGIFSDLQTLSVHAGIVPYDVNLPFWSDNAIKTRWFSIPDTSKKVGFNETTAWTLPAAGVWIKHFELEMTEGVPTTRRRLETRVLVRQPNGVYGFTYRWDPVTQANATLVGEDGLNETIEVTVNGEKESRVWRYPSRSECLGCHTQEGGFILGFNTRQLNRKFDYGGTVQNQISALSAMGYLDPPVRETDPLPVLAHATNSNFSLEYRVRSYLDVNCAYCHQPGAPGQGLWDARINTPLSDANIIDGPLLNNYRNPGNRIVTPGKPDLSMLLTRIKTIDTGRMPPIGSSLPDSAAIRLITDWIVEEAPQFETFDVWQRRVFGITSEPHALADADPDDDGAANYLEYLVGTDPLSPSQSWTVNIGFNGDEIQIQFPQIANRGFEVQYAHQLPAAQWLPLNVPDNRPVFAPSNRTAIVRDVISTNRAKFYRVRVYGH